MVNIKVSEKTYDELKAIKDEEELKSLDGAIRHILSTIPGFRNIRYGEYKTIFRSGAEYPVSGTSGQPRVVFEIPIELPVKQKTLPDDSVVIDIDDSELDCAIRFLEDLKRVRSSR